MGPLGAAKQKRRPLAIRRKREARDDESDVEEEEDKDAKEERNSSKTKAVFGNSEEKRGARG